MTAFPGLTKDLYALPPRGLTVGEVRMGDERIKQYTVLCEVDGCFATATSTKSEQSARDQVAGHRCPAPLHRGVIPMGKTLLEKMWDESDDALDAYKAGEEYLGMKGELLQGYIQGIAECLSFCAVPWFRIPEDVLRQMQRRWRMRQGDIPFEPTPSYRYNPPPPGAPIGVPIAPAVKARRTPTKSKKTATKQAAASVASSMKVFRPDEVVIIKTMLYENNVPAADLAKMYGVTEGRIRSIAGPPPGSETPQMFLGGLFGP